MTDNNNNRHLDRRSFLRASSAASATLASTKAVAAKSLNSVHFLEVGIDTEIIMPSDANYTPVFHHNDRFRRHQIKAGKLELPSEGASRLKKLAKNSNRLADATSYQKFPGPVTVKKPTNFLPISTSADLRPTRVVQIEDEYQPPTIQLDSVETKVKAVANGSNTEIEPGFENSINLGSFESRLKVAKRIDGELETYKKKFEIQPQVLIRNHGELSVVERS